MNIRTIWNEKGGVSKTTTAIQLAAGFAKAGKKTLLIDLDPQASLTELVTDEPTLDKINESENTISKVLLNPKDVNECIWKTVIEGVDIIPSTGTLNGTIYQLACNPALAYPIRLKKALKLVDYDEVILDNNPFYSLATMNSIVCADEIILPTVLEKTSLQSLENTLADINQTMEQIDDMNEVKIKILITQVDRLVIDREQERKIREKYGDYIYQTSIRTQKKAIKVANNEKKTLLDDNKSKVAEDYRNLIDEIIRGDK